MTNSLIANAVSANIPTPDKDTSEPVVCIANIGPQQQQRRLRFGLEMFAVGFVVGVLLIFSGVDHIWRIGLILPFYLGSIGFFQARDKT